jgi:predicted DNA-binding protein (MmcQ/YjbR family)
MSTAKKATAKKTGAKKTAAKKAAAKKTGAKKTAAKKTAAKKPAAKKPAAKQLGTKQPTPTTPERAGAPRPTAASLPALALLRDQLRAYALGLPAAWEDHPWGESVAKAGKKVFVFFGHSDDPNLREGLGMSVKLPQTADLVLALPFASPTGYGLGRAGWVTVMIPPADLPPLSVLTAWIDESYRAVAPKKAIAELAARRPM